MDCLGVVGLAGRLERVVAGDPDAAAAAGGGAAEVRALLDQHGVEALPRGGERGGHAGAAGADHDDVDLGRRLRRGRSWRKTVTGSIVWRHALRRRPTHGRRRPPGRRGEPRADPAAARDLARASTSSTPTRSSCSTSAAGSRPGPTVVGHKVGAVLEGDAGDDGRRRARLRPPARRHGGLSDDGRSPPSRYCYPRVEVEVGVRPRRARCRARAAPRTTSSAATEDVAPAIELIDSRIADWDIRIADTIADNASSAGFVARPERVDAATSSTCATIDAVADASTARSVAEGRSDAVPRQPGRGGAPGWPRKVAALRGPARGRPRDPARARCTARSTFAPATTVVDGGPSAASTAAVDRRRASTNEE